MNLVRLSYDSTNYYLIQSPAGWIMVDTGWAGTFPKLLHLLKRDGIGVDQIRHLVITHFHPDHAGLVEELKDHGAKLLLHHSQQSAVPLLRHLFKPEHGFRDIQPRSNLVVTSEQSRALLAQVGLHGELLPTPGHSDDSISLVLDDGCAFTGDLPGIWVAPAVEKGIGAQIESSWMALLERGAKTVYPGHGEPFDL